MPFKRKARVLFLDGGSGLAEQAVVCADRDWLEAKAGSVPIDAVQGEWADVVVTLDEEAERQCPCLPARVQKRHYPLSAGEGGEVLRKRVQGMAGGLKMLSRQK